MQLRLNCDVTWSSEKSSYGIIVRNSFDGVITCRYGSSFCDSPFIYQCYALFMRLRLIVDHGWQDILGEFGQLAGILLVILLGNMRMLFMIAVVLPPSPFHANSCMLGAKLMFLRII